MRLLKDDKPLGKFDYSPLFKLIELKGETLSALTRKGIISRVPELKIKRGESISSNIIASICNYFNCQPCDIISYIPPEE